MANRNLGWSQPLRDDYIYEQGAQWANHISNSQVTSSPLVMTQNDPGDRDYSLHLLSSDQHTDQGIVCVTSRSDSSEVADVTVADYPVDIQCQVPSLLQSPLPLPPSVTTQQSQRDPLPIRPFPLQEFLESHELSVLMSALEGRDDGTSLIYPSVLRQLMFCCFLASLQRPNESCLTPLFHLMSKVVFSYAIHLVIDHLLS